MTSMGARRGGGNRNRDLLSAGAPRLPKGGPGSPKGAQGSKKSDVCHMFGSFWEAFGITFGVSLAQNTENGGCMSIFC